jgi:hypothetical protein
MFDNTASSAATADALTLADAQRRRPLIATAWASAAATAASTCSMDGIGPSISGAPGAATVWTVSVAPKTITNPNSTTELSFRLIICLPRPAKAPPRFR